MIRSLPTALLCLLFAFMVGCADQNNSRPAKPWSSNTGACTFPVRFQLRSGQRVLYETWDRIPHEFGPGETVTIDWNAGTLTVNGFVHRPHASPPPWKVERLRRIYGDVPFVKAFVANAGGDSVKRWNDAANALEQLHSDLYQGAISTYGSALDSLGAVEPATLAAARWLEQSELVDSVMVRPPPPGIAAAFDTCCGGPQIEIYFAGEAYPIFIEMGRSDRAGNSAASHKDSGPTKEQACSIVRLMQIGLSNAGDYRVEFVRASICSAQQACNIRKAAIPQRIPITTTIPM